MTAAQMPSRAIRRAKGWRDAITLVRTIYSDAHGRSPHLLRPRRFTEKMQWRKLFDLDPRYAIFCDKLAVRDFIAARVGAEALTPLLWTGGPEDIPFDRLAPPYVLKSTHASGHVVMVDGAPDVEALRAQAAGWLGLNYGARFNEPGYTPVPPRLLIERTVTNAAGERPEEVRCFVFDGQVTVINTVFVEDGVLRNGAFHRPDWTPLDWHFSRRLDRPFPPPPCLAEMIRMAERLGEGIDHVRVDFYDGGDRFWIGEMTLYSWSGLSRFSPDEADFLLGREWRLRHPVWRAARAMLRQRPGELRLR